MISEECVGKNVEGIGQGIIYSICLEAMRKSNEILFPGGDLNTELPKYEAGAPSVQFESFVAT
jgi:hypothetical protein